MKQSLFSRQWFTWIERFALLLVFLFFLTYTLFPVFWGFSASFKLGNDVFSNPITLFPRTFTLDNYAKVLTDSEFMRSLLNSTLVALAVTLFSLIIGGAAAYGIGRFNFRGRSAVRYIILMMNVFPTVAVLPSLSAIIRTMGLTGSSISLILIYPMFTLPVTVWSMIAFFRALPPEIEQAAYADGATVVQLFFRIILPISLPILLTNGLAVFVSIWNEYLFALTFTAIDPTSRTMTVAIKFLQTQLSAGEMMAAAIVVTIPLLLIIYFVQRNFVTNTTEGAVKG